MGRLLALLGKHAAWALFGGVFIGLALPWLAGLARPLLAPSVVVILGAALLRADWGAMAGYARRPWLILGLIAWFMVVSPVVTWLVLKALGPPPALSAAIVLMAAAPPILAAVGLATLLGLDAALAAVAGLVSTALTPLTVPPLALALLGLEIDVPVGEFMARLVAVIGAAFMVAGVMRWRLQPAWIKAHARHIDGVFVLAMLVFAVAIMDGVGQALMDDPGHVALWLGAAFVANPALQLLGGLAFARFGRRRALTIALMTGNRNMGLLLAALPASVDFDVVLFFAVAQVPMFMLPAVLTPVYRRLTTHVP